MRSQTSACLHFPQSLENIGIFWPRIAKLFLHLARKRLFSICAQHLPLVPFFFEQIVGHLREMQGS
jgi:hypothetical protein